MNIIPAVEANNLSKNSYANKKKELEILFFKQVKDGINEATKNGRFSIKIDLNQFAHFSCADLIYTDFKKRIIDKGYKVVINDEMTIEWA